MQRQQGLGERVEIQMIDLAHSPDSFTRPDVDAMTSSGNRSSHSGNCVAVAAKRGRCQAGLPGIARMQREDGKGRRYRLLCGKAGANQLDDVAHRALMIMNIDQANRPLDTAS